MPYLGIFGPEFEKAIVILEIIILEFVKYEFLSHRMNFGIGSAFSESPGSAFSEGPCPGLDLLYKVYLIIYYKLCIKTAVNAMQLHLPIHKGHINFRRGNLSMDVYPKHLHN